MDFINQHIEELDYSSEIAKIDIQEMNDMHQSIIQKYITPNRAYIKQSVRGLLAKDVSFETLTYIYETCHQCTENDRFRAMVVCLDKFYKETKSVFKTEQLQKQLVGIMKNDKQNRIDSYDWVDKYSHNNNVFYLLEITIGVNKVFKYGITSNRLRQRIATLKNDIKARYNNKYLNINVLLILECEDNEVFENEIKILISENNLQRPNYDFKGSTELLKHNDRIYGLIDTASKKYNVTNLFDLKAEIAAEQKRLNEPEGF